MYLEQIQSYKYLGSTVNSDNSVEKEIQYRITLGNKAYYANQFLFKSRFVSKKSNLKLYWSIIRPTVTYACEVWVLKETIKRQVNGIWKESVKKDLWSYKRKRWYMGNQNKRWIRWINKTEVYNKSHKSTTIKLVWPFTSDVGRENGKKKYVSGNRCQYNHKEDQRTDGKMT